MPKKPNKRVPAKKKAPAKKPARKRNVLDQKERDPETQPAEEPQTGEGRGEAAESEASDAAEPKKDSED